MKDAPLISCLCITNDRVPFLKRSVRCFNAQTYPNKELIVVHKNDDLATIEFLNQIDQDNIIRYSLEPDGSLLGDVRNKAIEFSNGSYFCNWDDDDWYNMDRLTVQFESIYKNHQPVSFLTNVIMYDELNEQAYFSMFRLWEMTILCRKSEINPLVRYGSSQRREDTFLMNGLMETSRVFPTVAPSMFIYFIHGSNTMHRGHFEAIFEMAQKLSKPSSYLVRDILENKYSVEEGSRLLRSEEFLKPINFFTSINYIMYGQ